jgi:D-3-phosphoglycerate dehydrogenase
VAARPNRGWELGSKTIGIYGLGNAGSSLAEKLSGFGCKIIAYDKYRSEPQENVSLLTLDDFFDQADIVSVHVPLTEETEALFTIEYFKKFRKPILFINTARGEIAPLEDIRTAIDSGKVIQAGLDVLECEKFSGMSQKQKEDFDWLRDSGKVIFSPHVAGWTYESYARINVVLVEKIGAFLEGKDFS